MKINQRWFWIVVATAALTFGSTSLLTAQQEEAAAAGSSAQEVVEEAAQTVSEGASDAAAAVADGTRDAAANVANQSESVGRVMAAVPRSVDDVTQGARRGYGEFIQPMIDRTVEALPSLLKAIGFLIAFWILSIFLSWLAVTLLNKTELDNRLARDLGLSKAGSDFSIEKGIGTAVKWIVLLFGFVVFFEALDLNMVAGPLQSMLDKIASSVPAMLKAFLWLALYWVVGSLLRIAITRGLGGVDFDQRAARWIKPREIRGEVVGPSAMIGRLVFYVVLLFGLPPFLQALGQDAAVAPLQNMMTEFFGFLPNLVAAAIILFFGRIAATILREIVVNFLAAAGADDLAGRFGVGDVTGGKRLSDIVGTIVFFFVFIYALVVAVEKLGIEAITIPVQNTMEKLLGAIPLMFVAALVAIVGYFIARTVRTMVEGFLSGVGFDNLPNRLNLNFLNPKEGGASLSSIVGQVVMIVILLLTAQQALSSLGLEELSVMVGGLMAYLPNLLAGLLIILAALSLGSYVSGLVRQAMGNADQAELVARIAQWAIYFLGFSMGLNQLGVGAEIIQVAVTAVLGGAALALALAFGLGGREKAKEFLDRRI